MFLAKKKNVCDLLAVFVFLVLFAFSFYCVNFGLRLMDESLYITIAQKFADGARPLVDEWHVTQLSDLVAVLPYIVFKKITGGTDGVLLFMRRLFVIMNSLFFVVFYLKLRSYRVWGLITAALVSSFVPYAMFALNYYTMTIHTLMLIIVFFLLNKEGEPADDPLSTKKLLFAGVLLSAAVIIQPPLAFLYFLYSITVLIYVIIRRRKPTLGQHFAFFFNARCWLLITLSVSVCAFVFLVFLQVKSGLFAVFKNIPTLLDDPNYDLSAFKDLWVSFCNRSQTIISIFGPTNCVFFIGLSAIVFILYVKKSLVRYKYYLFFFSNLALVLWFAVPLISQMVSRTGLIWEYFSVWPISFFAFGLINYLLCEEKNRRLLLIWVFAVASSLFIDSISAATLGTYGILAAVPGVLGFGQIVREYKSDCQAKLAAKNRGTKTKGAKKQQQRMNAPGFFVILSGAALTVFLCLMCYSVYLQGTALLNEQKNQAPGVYYSAFQPSKLTKIETGPFKGVYTSENSKKMIYDYQSDLDVLKAQGGKRVYLNNPNPMAFIYLDMPTSNRFEWPSITFQSRHLEFFSEHPENRPDAIYFCYDFNLDLPDTISNDTISRFYLEYAQKLCSTVCSGHIIAGKKGIIVSVDQWKDTDYDDLIKWVEEQEVRISRDNNIAR